MNVRSAARGEARFFAFLLLVLFVPLTACEREGRIDAGGDAGRDSAPPEDARSDAQFDGTPDAAPDAAATPPTPLEMSRDQARADIDALASAATAVDSTLLEAAAELELDVALVRLDAVIGEKIGSPIDIAGVIGEKSMGGTRALRAPWGVIRVIERNLVQAAAELGAVLGALPTTDPRLEALRTALSDAIGSIMQLHTLLVARFAEIAMLDALLPGRESPGHIDRHSVHFVPDAATIRSQIDGTATDADGLLSLPSCPGAFAVVVFDEDDTSAPLLEATGQGPHAFTVRTDRPTRLRIEVTGGAFAASCPISIQGRRHFRGAPILLSGTEPADLRARASTWDDTVIRLAGRIQTLAAGGGSDGALQPLLYRYLRDAVDETGRWRAIVDRIEPEDLDELKIAIEVVIRLSMGLEASPEVASLTGGSMVIADFAELRVLQQQTLTDLLSP